MGFDMIPYEQLVGVSVVALIVGFYFGAVIYDCLFQHHYPELYKRAGQIKKERKALRAKFRAERKAIK
jgi:hypothetical protein